MSDFWKDRQDFKAAVSVWSEKLDVRTRAVSIRPMSRKWASCSSLGTLSFNEELLTMDRSLGEYVIVHELLHLRIPNHGKLWKSLMMAHLGDYQILEKKLRSGLKVTPQNP